MERKQVQLTARQASAVRKEAARRKTSDAAIVREAVDLWLRSRGHPADMNERWQRALRVVGAFRSGRKDISQKHDREFAEASRS
ncbi:MAG TPA: CopG family transcriptional regulator [Candidatus Bathyarchaeia archaeon]|nr:CopG family transcriptional regulator [Candidatus Bathyarchaeia archaeon]